MGGWRRDYRVGTRDIGITTAHVGASAPVRPATIPRPNHKLKVYAKDSVIRIFSGLIACMFTFTECSGQSAGKPPNSRDTQGVSPQERQSLAALYDATGGKDWKNHAGWLGPAGTECVWHGVECGRKTDGTPTVTSIELSENNLNGVIPQALDQLTQLTWLSLAGNRLRGQIPEPLIQHWLSGLLWIAAEAHLLADLTELDFELDPSALLCGRERVILRSDGTAVHYTKRCRNATREDRRTYCEVEQGHIWLQDFAKLAWLLDKNGFYLLQRTYDRSMTHGAFDSTRALKDGKTYEVVNYAEAGPLELWVIERAIEGSKLATEWGKPKTEPTCPRWKDGLVSQSW